MVRGQSHPPDEAIWFTGSTLSIWNEAILRETMEVASDESRGRTPIQQKVGDFWAACMNEKVIEETGVHDLAPELQRIDDLQSKIRIADEIAHLHTTLPAAWQRDSSQTPVPLFGFTSKQDFDNMSQQVVLIDQGGMGLPSRDFYLRNDWQSAEIRSKYRNHITKLLSLGGEPSQRAAQDAEAILAIETGMAQTAMDDVSRRDPKNLNNKMSFKDVQSLTPAFDWKRYVELVGAPTPDHYLVTSPQFFKGLEQLLQAHPLEHWKAYLRWQMLHLSSPQLGKQFADENFDFYYRTLAGMQEQLPRWRRCVRAADFYIGEALGQAYVERAVSARK